MCRCRLPSRTLDRQVDALARAGLAQDRVHLDARSGASTERSGLLRAAVEHARGGDVLVVHTLDRLGRTVRHTLNLLHELGGPCGRRLADTTDPGRAL